MQRALRIQAGLLRFSFPEYVMLWGISLLFKCAVTHHTFHLYTSPHSLTQGRQFQSNCRLLYKENHVLDTWFNEAYGDEQKTLLQ